MHSMASGFPVGFCFFPRPRSRPTNALTFPSPRQQAGMSSSTRFTHLFAGSNLNRLSVLRSNPAFLTNSLQSPSTRFIALRNLDALLTALTTPTGTSTATTTTTAPTAGIPPLSPHKQHIAYLTYTDVKPALDAGAFHVFLGVDEGDTEGTGEYTSERKGGVVVVKGRSYWAVDLTKSGDLDDGVLAGLDGAFTTKNYAFTPLRSALGSLPWDIESALIAQARSVVDWNVRNQYCPACGKLTESGEAGYKRFCPRPNLDEVGEGEKEATKRCLSLTGVNNFQYPRTDPVVIIAVTHPTHPHKLLLGRQTRFPASTYTCIAGFMEPGESIEEACAREVAEETGIQLNMDSITYHSSQPWPFPNSVMIGCLAQARSVDVSLVDEELEDARWFDREQVVRALARHYGGGPLPGEAQGQGEAEMEIKIPPPYAIAHQLIKAWVEGFKLQPAKM
ncbi:NUDIX hydrolase domain-like protein [Fimicolochytrium jonesii]|uniref:NUDIX hydrolase domain-like protein n=1 Tax=Fimicolochytrium jonesii TaxID=1396493 RepID=UPI0022FEF3CE|nr:NUDIX hydrolase domain-like protein [Fimicolochytrium jonesii]KAI8816136.1 NUDIX hydrolase domain-like protein [Fimicolochytrium jonesii]